MADPINVSFSNNSSVTIQNCVLYHLASEPDPTSWLQGSYSSFLNASNIAPGQTLPAVSVGSEWMPGDYWFGTILYEGNPTTYFIAGEVSTDGILFPAYKECNVPSGGSARISIKMASGNNINAGYIYVNNPDGSDDGGANFNLMDVQSLAACAILSGLTHLAA